MKQITDLDELSGKTIEGVYECDNMMAIHFKGAEYILLKAAIWDENAEIDVYSYEMKPSKYNIYNMHELHLLSDEEYNRLRDQLNKEEVNKEKESEITLLKKLKAKYPGV